MGHGPLKEAQSATARSPALLQGFEPVSISPTATVKEGMSPSTSRAVVKSLNSSLGREEVHTLQMIFAHWRLDVKDKVELTRKTLSCPFTN